MLIIAHNGVVISNAYVPEYQGSLCGAQWLISFTSRRAYANWVLSLHPRVLSRWSWALVKTSPSNTSIFLTRPDASTRDRPATCLFSPCGSCSLYFLPSKPSSYIVWGKESVDPIPDSGLGRAHSAISSFLSSSGSEGRCPSAFSGRERRRRMSSFFKASWTRPDKVIGGGAPSKGVIWYDGEGEEEMGNDLGEVVGGVAAIDMAWGISGSGTVTGYNSSLGIFMRQELLLRCPKAVGGSVSSAGMTR